MTQTRPALFISHSKKDEAWALRLHDALVKDGYGAFLDSHPDDGIHPGADWEKMLWRQLQQCGGVVVLCSANWLVSPWCVAEAMIAREHGKKIILLATVDVIDGRQVKGEEGAKDAPRIPDFLKTKQFLPVVGLTDGEVYRRLQRSLKEEKLNEEFKPPEHPYPGLKWFEETDAAVFFGRREEMEHVQNVLNLRRLNKAKGFIVVLGASGCGKSSLVRAGVLPRLRRAGEERDSGAEWVLVPPFFGGEGLEGLAFKLENALDKAGKPEAPDSISEQLEAVREQKGGKEGAAKALRKLAKSLLRAHGLPDAHVLVVLDQLEEVFAPDTGSDARAMLRLLLDVSAHPASRVVVLATMRSDFLNDFQLFEGAAERYEKITLDPMPRSRFAEVIEGPAARCALRLGPGLTERMVEDTKYSDALPLLAFTLEKLYEEGSADGELTLEEYERLFPETEVRAADGTQTTERGVVCAIKKVADEILKQTGFAGLKDDDPRMRDLRRAFYSLSQVGEEGQFTRRSARWSQMPISCKEVLRRFVERRLLVSSGRENPAEEDQTERVLSVAHEALFRVWDTLNGWLREDRKALALRTQIEEAASEWQAENRADSRAWAEERVLDAVREIQVSGVSLADVADPNTVDAFLGPSDRDELEALVGLDATEDAAAGSGRYGDAWRLPLSHTARASVGVRLDLLGDRRKGVGLRAYGLPDIDWRRIGGGEVTIEIRTNPDDPNSKVVKRLSRLVEAFWMARYPVTIAQFGAFLEDCYQDGQWRLPPGCPFDLRAWDWPPPKHRARFDNHPADSVNWYDAMTFCHWLSSRLGFEVRLPTEYEWQLAATGGEAERRYPWGGDWDPQQEPWRANTLESELVRTTAVGMYPAGAAPAGILDMAGTVWEWCLDPFETSETRGGTWLGRVLSKPSVEQQRRVLRGGSWSDNRGLARSASRIRYGPGFRGDNIGFRVVCSSPSSDTDH